jgi:hypothetical protein
MPGKSCGVLNVKGLTIYTILYTEFDDVADVDLGFIQHFLDQLVPVKCGEFLTNESFYKNSHYYKGYELGLQKIIPPTGYGYSVLWRLINLIGIYQYSFDQRNSLAYSNIHI